MKWNICSLLMLGSLICAATNAARISEQRQDYAKNLKEALNKLLGDYQTTGIMSPQLQKLLIWLDKHNNLKKFDSQAEDPTTKIDLSCDLCSIVFTGFIDERRNNNATNQQMAEMAIELCILVQLVPDKVCIGLVNLNVDILLYIFDARPQLTGDTFCSFLLQDLECPGDASYFEWNVNVDPNKPLLTTSKDEYYPPSANDLTIVHIADPHLDPKYQFGANAACDDPVCCRYDQEPASSVADEAGYWGDYRSCDSPGYAVRDAFEHIRRQHSNIDYVYFTGDIIDHGVWETTESQNIISIREVSQLLYDAFGNLPVFPVLGNHEGQPVNIYAPSIVDREEFLTTWLYNTVAVEWSRWLPAAALDTVRLGGYYTVLVRPGFRVITINNNDCYTYNWWVLYQPDYSSRQLQWLHNTLLAAEAANEKVHILGHIPMGSSDCYKVYAREYRRIVERFWKVISAQFCGHSHNDEFNVYLANNDVSIAHNVIWNGGSTTAYSNVNPNYKVYGVDPNIYQVNKNEGWIYNLTLANLTPGQNPVWFREYDFAQEYSISNFSPAGLSALVDDFARNPQKLSRYSELRVNMADTALASGCNAECRANNLCGIVQNQHGDRRRCDTLLTMIP